MPVRLRLCQAAPAKRKPKEPETSHEVMGGCTRFDGFGVYRSLVLVAVAFASKGVAVAVASDHIA